MRRTLLVLEPISLVAVFAAMALSAYFHVEQAALLTAAVAVLALLPFFLRVEMERPRPRDIMPIAVLAAVAAGGRILFGPVPNFQPVTAVVILAGVCFGRQSGFLTGALAALASNLFFGQGAWTPWQMYAWGLAGYLAGVLKAASLFRRNIAVYCYGAAVSMLYGFIMDTWFWVGFLGEAGTGGAAAAYLAGLPFNLIHAASTVFFLLLVLTPWGKKLERVKKKYGVAEFGTEEEAPTGSAIRRSR